MGWRFDGLSSILPLRDGKTVLLFGTVHNGNVGIATVNQRMYRNCDIVLTDISYVFLSYHIMHVYIVCILYVYTVYPAQLIQWSSS